MIGLIEVATAPWPCLEDIAQSKVILIRRMKLPKRFIVYTGMKVK